MDGAVMGVALWDKIRTVFESGELPMLYLKRIPVVLFLVLIRNVCLANDWPQWWGPNRDDLSAETGLLQAWPESGPPLQWKASGLGLGFSTVSVVDGKIYTAGDIDGAFCVHALRADDGKILWTTKVGKAGKMGGFTGPRSTPTIDGDVLYIIGQFGELACLKITDGTIVWQKHLAKDFGGNPPG